MTPRTISRTTDARRYDFIDAWVRPQFDPKRPTILADYRLRLNSLGGNVHRLVLKLHVARAGQQLDYLRSKLSMQRSAKPLSEQAIHGQVLL